MIGDVEPLDDVWLREVNEKLANAAENGRASAVKKLLAMGANPSCTVTRNAGSTRNLDDFKDVKMVSVTPLHMSAQYGYTDCAEALLTAKAEFLEPVFATTLCAHPQSSVFHFPSRIPT